LFCQQNDFSNENELCFANKTIFQTKIDFVPKAKPIFKRKMTLFCYFFVSLPQNETNKRRI